MAELKKEISKVRDWDTEVKVSRSPQKIHDSEIMVTDHYDWFKLDIRNRPINQKRVHHWMKQFSNGNFFMKDFPAVVNNDWVILDGQHRYMACKTMGLQFYFRLACDITIEKIVDVQQNAAWSSMDFVHAQVQQKNQNYVVLQRFIKRYKVTATVAVLMLNGGQDSLKDTGFYTGDFKVEDETAGHEIAGILFDICENSEKVSRGKIMCLSVIRMYNVSGYDHKRMLSQLEKYPGILKPQVNSTEQLKNLEAVYNYRLNEKNKARFI